jgi:dihydropteroate synthase
VTVPAPSARLRLGGRDFGPGVPVLMAVINRTPDSFYAGNRMFDEDRAAEAVARAEAEGADIVDVGGVKAGPGADVDTVEELRRVVPFLARVRASHPGLLLSVDTWRAEVAREACAAGADLINDTWAGHDPELPAIAAAAGVGLVCSHTGGAVPRTRPHRVAYDSAEEAVVDDVLTGLKGSARRAMEAGVPGESLLLDPTHDFGKNTWHGLALLRRTESLVALGHPVVLSL